MDSGSRPQPPDPIVKSFFDYTRLEIAAALGHPARSNRVFQAVYRGRALSGNDKLAIRSFDFSLPALARRYDSADGTRRYLFRLRDTEVESVTIPDAHRFTFCVSSQVGCALACRFCLTGQLGLTRNLSAGEIVAQVLAQRGDIPANQSARFSVVFMGMGEPLQNYDNVIHAIRILTDDYGLALPLHRITVSTAGLVPGIRRLGSERLFPNLSISLTGATNKKRNDLMPINQKYPIEDVIRAVGDLPASRRTRVMFEYVMMKGVTDSVEDAENISLLLRGLRAKVNLIPLNESPFLPFQRAGHSDILRFQQVLLSHKITTFIRKTRGNDVSGACGQLSKDKHAGQVHECGSASRQPGRLIWRTTVSRSE
jgi:23S rRNA (adenine2503-C2)-methyltransferase